METLQRNERRKMRFSVSLLHNAGSILPESARAGSHVTQLASAEEEEEEEENEDLTGMVEGRHGAAAGL